MPDHLMLIDHDANVLRVMGIYQGGRALFTQPNTPVKCGGAPQKIM
jgi:sulfide:quinone oxidoreductase